ncbi:MAG: stress response translation initiation inhibitor YciH [Porticoccaceae bacterium]|nr:stress response translation initiation inhibitor YciH [Porticoccaceae bacterium]
MNKNSRLVYSTDGGRVKTPGDTDGDSKHNDSKYIPSKHIPSKHSPSKAGRSKTGSAKQGADKNDGIVRIRRETSGRKGKGVTTINGLTLAESELKALAKQLKQNCSTGGTVKDGVIEIQGDHRDKIRDILTDAGYQVKLAGG